MPALEGRCHCGAVSIEVPRKPACLTHCSCSICRRYGALWMYFKPSAVRIHARRKDLRSYAWGPRDIRFVRCSTCGCVMCWQPARRGLRERMGVNARNFDPGVLRGVRVRQVH